MPDDLAFCSPGPAHRIPCPTFEMLLDMICVLPPRGPAWQTGEDVAEYFLSPLSLAGGSTAQSGEAEAGVAPLPTVQQQFWAAIAEFFAFVHERICALLSEFLCSAHAELVFEWGADYGFPDPCEPYETLCDKVRAQGGATCGYLADRAAGLGWSIECRDCGDFASSAAGCADAGCAVAGCQCRVGDLYIIVKLAESPFYTDPGASNAAGHAVAGCSGICDPNPLPLICLIERIRPAHLRAYYLIV